MAQLTDAFWQESYQWEYCPKSANCAHWLDRYLLARTGRSHFPKRWQRAVVQSGISGLAEKVLDPAFKRSDAFDCDFGLCIQSFFINCSDGGFFVFLDERGISTAPHKAIERAEFMGWKVE